MEVDQSRLREDILANGEFGSVEADRGNGRTVLTGSEADRRARQYLVEQFEALDMAVDIDAVGNITGRWVPDEAERSTAPVAMGSHLDSVPRGGLFDGPLGVYAALEAVRVIRDSDVDPVRPIEVVCFTEEEGGRFDVGVLGSSVACGEYPVDDALALEDDDGVSLEEHLDRIGFRGEERLDASAWDRWFEVHIEQGKRLEARGVPVGVVTAITGIVNCEVTITGEANHAGTTPMAERTDALAAASRFVLDVERAAREVAETDSESTVGTVGKMHIAPNARNVVPGQVRVRTDFRDVTHAAITELVDRARKSLRRLESERGVDANLDLYREQAPTPMHEGCRDALHDSAERAGIEAINVHSGGGHDTMNVARVSDAALVFAPSRDGVSHHPTEWTDWDECADVARVLAGAVADSATT
jgi:N-carbamoyl-L-amino-acid hydrolase